MMSLCDSWYLGVQHHVLGCAFVDILDKCGIHPHVDEFQWHHPFVSHVVLFLKTYCEYHDFFYPNTLPLG